MKFFGDPRPPHGGAPAAIGVLVTNLGTPDAPTAPALRRYLREFLSDPRVVERNRLLWWTILNLFVLPRRPRASAALYRKVWEADGSPLLSIGRRQAAGIARRLGEAAAAGAPPVHVALGMRYGNPSIGAALRELFAQGCRRLVVLPLYPQYFSGTGGSTFDAVARELVTWRWVPELRMVQQYHDEPGYVAALARSLEEAWADSRPDKLLFSFHGIPVRYFAAGDPYFCHCQKTARLVAERLGLADDAWDVSFQSLFGREEWIKPYTDRTVQAMAHAGVRRLDVICPGFAADCLETLEEIAGLNRELFEHAGGERLRYVPALNDRPDHLEMLAGLVRRTAGEWLAAPAAGDREDRARGAGRAAAMAQAPRPADGGYGAGAPPHG